MNRNSETGILPSVEEIRSSGPVGREAGIASIKKRLLRQKKEIIESFRSPGRRLQEQTNYPDELDQATAEASSDFIIRLKERERRLLMKLEDALDRIEEGSYGICESCGFEIEMMRLESKPVATLCIECQKEQEADELLSERLRKAGIVP